MKYSVSRNERGIAIDSSGDEGGQRALMAALVACQDGLCRCPMANAIDLDAVQMVSTGEAMRLTIPTRIDCEVDLGVLQRCLDNTIRRL